MALTLETAAKNAAVDAVVDLIDGGSGDANGDLVFLTSGDVEVATLAFGDPAFGAASSGTATANSITADSSATGGTVAKFKIQDKSNAAVFSGTVTATGGGGDIELTSVTVGAGASVSISSLTLSAP